MSYKISIILPVYNVASYVNRCLDSLLSQTLQDIEVIFVDDRGSDNSIDVIHNYIVSHHLELHWHVIASPQNSGPALARNLGLSTVQGEYIAFVDADDWIEPNMMQTLYDTAIEYQADICSSAAILDYPNGSHKTMLNPYVGSGTITTKKRKYLLRHYVSNFTTMLFKRDWLNQYQLQFPNAKSGEDSSFMGQCYLVANNIAQLNDTFYHYVIHSASISHRKGVFRGMEKHKAFSALFHFAQNNQLMHQYRWSLYWIYIKKVIITSIADYIKTL